MGRPGAEARPPTTGRLRGCIRAATRADITVTRADITVAQAAAVAVTADQAVATAGQEAAAADQVVAAAGQEAVAAGQEAAEAAVPEPDASGHRFLSTPDPAPLTMIGAAEREYLCALVGRLREALEDHLIAFYALGGLALGDYRPGRSDLDVYAVVTGPLDARRKRAVVDRCRHAQLPCPARKLELVVISAHVARRPGRAPHWELNLNTEPARTRLRRHRPHGRTEPLVRHRPRDRPPARDRPVRPRAITADRCARRRRCQPSSSGGHRVVRPPRPRYGSRHCHLSRLVLGADRRAFASKPDALRWCRSRLTPDD